MAPKNKKELVDLEKRTTQNEEDIKKLLGLVETIVSRLTGVHELIQTGSMTNLTTLQVLGGRLNELEERLKKLEPSTDAKKPAKTGVKKSGTTTRRNDKD